ncbi:platelet-activating factor acetylhydrolase 2, cytoplasmic-like isoform X1 [Hypanus sabinus]|uniref:platelet-activating factor acetylhydrolase 2, cytoplasmic-like isoform X1 n=2 Tax=Hypanus sabinus TaxID=79690 RepID=UPI0028C48C90|nr:platelet-activating factor acetylhydrolase 2, cytoplasmic-like isoform X1 [Hypanus sabinus]XP_059810713.1 platelet-activating factor acetylhydrolase 2, cytoplasmic-like isoform X1 [Hypanus sabinus]
MGSSQSLGVPSGSGPFKVGCTDVMVDHTRQGSFFRLYYPCEDEQLKPVSWIPQYQYFIGLADYLDKSKMWFPPLLSLAFGHYSVPVGWNASFRAVEKYPVIIFSHGLGAFRTVYSSICLEMASQGFLVAAMEHRDESAACTYYFKLQAEEHSAGAHSKLEEVWLPVRKLNAGEEEFPLRNSQLSQRVKECVQVLDILSDINSGTSINNVLPDRLDLSDLKGYVDLQKVAVMGHSFGGSTSILALAEDKRFRCAVALDAWMLPLAEDVYSKDLGPLFCINSEKFQTEDSIEKLKRLQSTNNALKIITILGSVHQSQTDFTLLTGDMLSRAFETRGTINPLKGLEITNRAALAFLQRHLDLQKDFDKWDALVEGNDAHLVSGPDLSTKPAAD